MGRSRRSAKQAGTRFERTVADYLAQTVSDLIDRRPKTGAKDKGDIAGVRLQGHRLVLECKDRATLALPRWLREAEEEAHNDDALLGVVVHKRRGVADPAQQYVSMTLESFARILRL